MDLYSFYQRRAINLICLSIRFEYYLKNFESISSATIRMVFERDGVVVAAAFFPFYFMLYCEHDVVRGRPMSYNLFYCWLLYSNDAQGHIVGRARSSHVRTHFIIDFFLAEDEDNQFMHKWKKILNSNYTNAFVSMMYILR